MPLYKTPLVSKDQPIVNPRTGCVTPYFQQALLNISQFADQGAAGAADFSPQINALQANVATINGQITTINSALSGKAPLASPALTGNPTAPTPTAGDNDTSIATTAFVQTAVATRVGKTAFAAYATPTGTQTRTTFDTSTVTLSQLAEHVAAIIADLKI